MADTADTSFQVITPDFVNVIVTNSKEGNNANCIPKRYPKGITIADLKGKLELLTGGNAATMSIVVYTKEDTLLCTLDNDSALLGSYPIEDGMRLHVIDKFVLRNEFEEASNAERFQLSEEEYAKRTDTLKHYLEQNRLGKYSEEEMRKREEERLKEEAADEAVLSVAKVGNRCEVKVPQTPTRRGTVMFIGPVDFKPGTWIGVKYDEPKGKNDGSVNGKRYFEYPPKYGGFVRPMHITIRDFPEETFDFEEDEM
ncbi:tubulin-folding cofactor B isoform X2 [Anabrus simplex]|uniref:tubulin-folding cofactor B isoform X2 n=1 Tax=Anabrus simplex TaxID=316456 RepID=UPI0035A37F9A